VIWLLNLGDYWQSLVLQRTGRADPCAVAKRSSQLVNAMPPSFLRIQASPVTVNACQATAH
jgi:hypothetical protein